VINPFTRALPSILHKKRKKRCKGMTLGAQAAFSYEVVAGTHGGLSHTSAKQETQYEPN
jgi:hypothetical protein